MKETAVEWLEDIIKGSIQDKLVIEVLTSIFNQAKAMEKNNMDNKVIHFAEWLTKKHTTTLITLYEHFEEEYYNETYGK
jgi:hypothetical protein